MSDASYVECAAPNAALQFLTRNDWFVDTLRRLSRVAPPNPTVSILAVQLWQQEIRHDYGGYYVEVERRHMFDGSAAQSAAHDIREFIAWCAANAAPAVRAVEGEYGNPQFLLEAIVARRARDDPATQSMGGEDGEGYEFLFDVLESIAALLQIAAEERSFVRFSTRRNADWD
jgi:hypothetical protein